MSEKMKWLLMLMLVSLSRSRLCRDNCSCQEVTYWTREIRCPSDSNPKFIAHCNDLENIYHIECQNATSWSEFGYQSDNRPQYVIGLLEIERCALPDKFYDDIIKRFGSKSSYYLKFTSHMNLSSTTLTAQHFSTLPGLRILNLSSNGLIKLPSDVFRELRFLYQLDLSSNRIAMLSGDIFHGLSDLQKIDLSYNAMKFINWRLFGNCTHLYHLSLRGNLLTCLDHRTFRNTYRLRNIDLAENLLETLPPDTFEYLLPSYSLSLDISGNKFSTLPEELFSRKQLKSLVFGNNRGSLTILPINFLNNSTKLEEVILIRNNLTSLAENIFWDSFSVQSIYLQGNFLSEFPKNIFKDLKALVHLDLSDNRLNYVPEGLFSALSKLQRLNLARNGISSLSADIFKNLDSLFELNLEINNITDIHPATFRKLQRIQLIRLSHNSVDLEADYVLSIRKYFSGTAIQQIFLDHNNLIGEFSIGAMDYTDPTNLQLVDLSYNQVSKVHVWSPLSGSHDVKYDLRHNNLRSLVISNKISSEMNILADDNPLNCGCQLYALLKYAHEIGKPQSGENLKIIFGNASCSEPYWMKGTQVASLRLETFTCRLDKSENDPVWVECVDGCDCWWRPHDETGVVNCSSRNLTKMPNEYIEFSFWSDDEGRPHHWKYKTSASIRTESRRYAPVELDLTHNSITKIPPMEVSAFKYVKKLLLSHNNILKLSFDVLPPKLETLHLDHNDLERFDQVALNAIIDAAALKELNLEGNPWSCASHTRSALYSIEKNLGPNLLYSMKDCLDHRNAPNIKKTSPLYIRYTMF